MKRFNGKTLLLLMLPVLAFLVLGLALELDSFTTRPVFHIVKNEILIKNQLSINANGQPGKAIHNVEYEIRRNSWLGKFLRRESSVELQNFDSSCIDSKTGKAFISPTGGILSTTPGRERCYAFYRLKDLRKSSGDLKLTMTLFYLEIGTLKKWPVSLIVPHSKLQK